MFKWASTQVVKGEVRKTFIQRFESVLAFYENEKNIVLDFWT